MFKGRIVCVRSASEIQILDSLVWCILRKSLATISKFEMDQFSFHKFVTFLLEPFHYSEDCHTEVSKNVFSSMLVLQRFYRRFDVVFCVDTIVKNNVVAVAVVVVRI